MKRSITPTNEVESKFGKTELEAEFKIDNVVQSNTRQQLVRECKRAKTILARKKDDVQEMYRKFLKTTKNQILNSKFERALQIWLHRKLWDGNRKCFDNMIISCWKCLDINIDIVNKQT